jgi:hypothetical protein
MLPVWIYKFCELFDESNCVATLRYPHRTHHTAQAKRCHNNRILCAWMIKSHLFQSLATLGNLEAFVKPCFERGCRKR